MTSDELRQAFIDFFQRRQHEIVPSSSLIPANDPTLLFTNSGMVQFKEMFLGLQERNFKKAASVQRCVRAGGKHNDLENVGFTARHHTFFEMLGNFSFGDYFKKEAIVFAWEFLTKVLKLPQERLWVSVFKDDKESEAIWLDEMQINPQHFSRCDEADNFWQMGETGPCGPCTEIFYDHGSHIFGGPPGSPEQNGDRYVEIWNLVFMQYNKDMSGNLKPLPNPCVDTGMGLERIAAVMQGVHDNYDIDIFKYILHQLAGLINFKDTQNNSMRVIADHIRAAVFLIYDGVVPSNEGRGYVLRRIIRRAARHGYKLSCAEPFFYQLSDAVFHVMKNAYPEILVNQNWIKQTILEEEELFTKTLTKGLKILSQELENLGDKITEIPGSLVFQLYDTYGFPPDITSDIAKEKGLNVDFLGFNAAMDTQREQSSQAQQFQFDYTQKTLISGKTEFVGYDNFIAQGQVTTLLKEHKPVSGLMQSDKGAVVLNVTPFYAESGGQVGDVGYLYFDGGRFRVTDTQKQGEVYLHIGELIEGNLTLKTPVRAEVDAVIRRATMLNHSATHLLHEALRRVLGEHAQQKGSLVEPKRLRFDFSHAKPLSIQELHAVERLVNQQIRRNLESHLTKMTPEEAREKGALALFGERYGKEVRVLRMGEFSTEICGGTHVENTGEVGLFKIVSESACASGVRRIEALTGEEALNYVLSQEEKLQTAANFLKTNVDNVLVRLQQLTDENKKLEKELHQLQHQHSKHYVDDLVQNAVKINNVSVVVQSLKEGEIGLLRDFVDILKAKLKNAVILLALVQDYKITFIGGVTKDCLAFFNAVELVSHVAKQVGGKGGGRPELAQGGGTQPEHLPAALQSVFAWVEDKLK